ncbi:MAG TPA: alpha/beta fold hydrolase [Acidobacteriota bacterium]|jgi:hypothetical protein
MPDKFDIEFDSNTLVSATLYRATRERLGVTLILAHGAGSNQNSSFLVSFANNLAARGVDTVTFNFPYMERGKRVPDPPEKLEACYGAAIARVLTNSHLRSNKLAIGGKSLGGRIASHVAASDDQTAASIAALIFLGYPLHPPGKPQQQRVKHLPHIRVPMLFVQGSRDAFGTPKELEPIIKQLDAEATLYVVENGDHSLTVPKKWPVPQEKVFEAVQDRIADWLRKRLTTGTSGSA